MSISITTFLDRFRSLGLDGTPCNMSEIEELERSAERTLPAAYKAYLLIAGREPPSSLVGSDCAIRHLAGLHDAAEELLREGGQPALPGGSFVFLMHQGYQFFYFVADGSSDDPPVFYYYERRPSIERKHERFSDFIAICQQDAQRCNQSMP